MTDVHCHLRGGNAAVRELVCGEQFLGVHPWDAEGCGAVGLMCDELRRRLSENPKLGVGEIGLDRLKDRSISPRMREVFEAQLALGFELGRPIVLHGAKCWGQVVERVKKEELKVKNCGCGFLFHGFSRSDGLIPEIARLGGFVSVGPAVLNDHAVNYRELVKRIPDECLVLETDRTAESATDCPDIARICAKVAELRGTSAAELERLTDANALRFYPW